MSASTYYASIVERGYNSYNSSFIAYQIHGKHKLQTSRCLICHGNMVHAQPYRKTPSSFMQTVHTECRKAHVLFKRQTRTDKRKLDYFLRVRGIIE